MFGVEGHTTESNNIKNTCNVKRIILAEQNRDNNAIFTWNIKHFVRYGATYIFALPSPTKNASRTIITPLKCYEIQGSFSVYILCFYVSMKMLSPMFMCFLTRWCVSTAVCFPLKITTFPKPLTHYFSTRTKFQF